MNKDKWILFRFSFSFGVIDHSGKYIHNHRIYLNYFVVQKKKKISIKDLFSS